MKQRVAVARLLGDIFRRDLVIGAGLVLHHHLGAEIGDEMLRQKPPEHIGDAARRRRHDDGDRLRRIIVGKRRGDRDTRNGDSGRNKTRHRCRAAKPERHSNSSPSNAPPWRRRGACRLAASYTASLIRRFATWPSKRPRRSYNGPAARGMRCGLCAQFRCDPACTDAMAVLRPAWHLPSRSP